MPLLSRLLPFAAAMLALGWGFLWIIRGARGPVVHVVLGASFAVLVAWGALRARPRTSEPGFPGRPRLDAGTTQEPEEGRMQDDLEHPPRLREREPLRLFPPFPPSSMLLAIGALAIAVGALALYFHLRPEPRPGAVPRPHEAAAVQPASEETSPFLPVASTLPALPLLDASDEALRALVAPLARTPEWGSWIQGEGLVRRVAAGALAMHDGSIPRPLTELVSFRERFEVEPEGSRRFIAESTHARYEPLLATLESIDLDGAVRIWLWARPLVEQAWQEIAPPERTLSESVREGIDRLLATPTPPARIEVTDDAGVYRFADPRLETATPASKLLLRMGASRGERLRAWLVRIRERI